MCICIAVIHHLSTAARRLAAIKELARIIRPGGRILISVWALEQDFGKTGKKNDQVGKTTRTDSKTSFTPKDVEEPDFNHESSRCSTNSNIETTASGAAAINNDVSCKQELCSSLSGVVNSDTNLVSHCDEEARLSDTSEILSSSSNTSIYSSNETGISTRGVQNTGDNAAFKDEFIRLKVNATRNVFEQQDLLIPWHYRGQTSCTSSRKKKLTGASDKRVVQVDHDEQELNSPEENQEPKVYQRFYHVFKANELEDECRELDDISVVRCYYDKGNWCVELKKVADC